MGRRLRMDEPVYVVFNPESGKGRGARLIEPVLGALRLLGCPLDHGRTTHAGEEGDLAERAIGQGFRTIVAVGGDGTWSNVAGAILKSGEPVKLGLVAGGTGCDLAKSLGIPAGDIPACARIIREGLWRAIDVGRVEERYFLNVAGFGYDIAVIEDSWRVRYLRGSLLYLYCALRQVYSFPGLTVEIEVDGVSRGREELLMLIVANGRVFGGGFRIAPRADLTDGKLDGVTFRNVGPLGRLKLIGQLRRGTHEAAPETEAASGSSFILRFDRPPAYETDGEWNRAEGTEIRVDAVPAALRMLVPGGRP